MKSCKILFLFILITILNTNAQSLIKLKPELGDSNIFLKQEQTTWEKALDQLSKINSYDMDYENLPPADKLMIDSLEQGYGPMTEGVGCSWYCGGGPYKVTSSSYLAEQGNINYLPDNLHDFNLFTAWVPDTKNGITGKKINFHFKPFSPRVNKIVIWNGYLKNKELWEANSRAKKLKLYINNKPIAILELDDVTSSQSFAISPVQSTDSTKDLILTLEVLEVYNGSKFKDLAISEINFDGLDVHCFTGETMITMADKSQKEIKNIKEGDKVMSYDINTKQFFATEVINPVTARHSGLVEMHFDATTIIATDDHPFLLADNHWASLNPEKSNENYIQDNKIVPLKVDDNILSYTSGKPVAQKFLSSKILDKEQLTYTLMLKDGNCFIANGLLVKTESLILVDSK